MDNIDLREDTQEDVQEGIPVPLKKEVWRPHHKDEMTLRISDDDKVDSSENIGNNNICSRMTVNTNETVSKARSRQTNETSSRCSGRKRKSSPVDIDVTRCKDNNSLYKAESNSLPSPLPSHFANHDDLFLRAQPRRKTIFCLSSENTFHEKPSYREEGYKSLGYTSLKNEIRKQSKTQPSKQKVNGLGLKRLNQSGNISTEEKSQKNVGKQSFDFGIHEKVFECCLGDWILTDLDLNVYETEQARDIKYLREKRKHDSFVILVMRKCSIL